MRNDFVRASSSIAGTIIGAGIFGVPFVVEKAGFWWGTVLFAALTVMILLLHLMYGEVVERTRGKHRLMGYVARYFGKKGRDIFAFSVILAVYGGLIVYILIANSFLNELFGPLFDSSIGWAVVFWGVLGIGIVKGIKTIARAEVVMLSLLLLTLVLIALRGLPLIDVSNFTLANWENAALPYGAILFSLSGFSAIPELKSIIKRDKKAFRNSIIAGTLSAAVITYLFAFVVVGVTGSSVTGDAITGLAPFIGREIVYAGMVFGLLAFSTSYLIIGVNLKESFVYDWGITSWISNFLILAVPIAVVLLGVRSFVAVLGVVGAVFGGVNGAMTVFLYFKAKKYGLKKPSYSINIPKALGYVFIIALIAGGLYEIIEVLAR